MPGYSQYDGLPVAWTIGTSPNAELADGMLSDACSKPAPAVAFTVGRAYCYFRSNLTTTSRYHR